MFAIKHEKTGTLLGTLRFDEEKDEYQFNVWVVLSRKEAEDSLKSPEFWDNMGYYEPGDERQLTVVELTIKE
jgi:hypothetical protein